MVLESGDPVWWDRPLGCAAALSLSTSLLQPSSSPTSLLMGPLGPFHVTTAQPPLLPLLLSGWRRPFENTTAGDRALSSSCPQTSGSSLMALFPGAGHAAR